MDGLFLGSQKMCRSSKANLRIIVSIEHRPNDMTWSNLSSPYSQTPEKHGFDQSLVADADPLSNNPIKGTNTNMAKKKKRKEVMEMNESSDQPGSEKNEGRKMGNDRMGYPAEASASGQSYTYTNAVARRSLVVTDVVDQHDQVT